ncbi:MAG: hypothetical protein MRY83_00705 [Flavobacteriales bacterium]|nr:hypothetical protein [Flavobacteriales bacterium]
MKKLLVIISVAICSCGANTYDTAKAAKEVNEIGVYQNEQSQGAEGLVTAAEIRDTRLWGEWLKVSSEPLFNEISDYWQLFGLNSFQVLEDQT